MSAAQGETELDEEGIDEEESSSDLSTTPQRQRNLFDSIQEYFSEELSKLDSILGYFTTNETESMVSRYRR
ncbi:unnamed protein product [Trichobilharzia regenti]|nr:unnamed protein product [Trichobilharzia regenti]